MAPLHSISTCSSRRGLCRSHICAILGKPLTLLIAIVWSEATKDVSIAEDQAVERS